MTRIGKYVVARELGRGGMGIVYEARDPALDRSVALKLVSERGDPARFLREAQAAAKVIHPNCVPIFDVGEHEGSPFLVMELVEGVSASEFLEKRGPLGWRTATRIVAAACRGLVAVHEAGVIHRDVKPSNLLIAKSGAVKLADFGLARDVGKGAPTLTGDQVVGTPHFMSPEQCWKEPVDARSDIYSLGATYYVLLTGRPPYHAPLELQIMFAHCNDPVPDPRRIASELPAECADIVRKAMAKAPADRYRSAREMLAALEHVLSTVTTEDKRDSSPAMANIGDDTPQPFPGARTKGGALAPPTTGDWASEPGRRGGTTPGGVAAKTPLAETRADDPEPVAPTPADARPTRRRWLLAAVPATVAAIGVGGFFAFRKPDKDEKGGGPATGNTTPIHVAKRNVGGAIGILGVAISDDSRWLAVAMNNPLPGQTGGKGVKLYDRARGNTPEVWWQWKDDPCEAVAFSPDGKYLAVATGGTAKVRVWDLEKHQELPPLKSKADQEIRGNVRSVAFSPDGKWLAAGYVTWSQPNDGGVRIWERSDGWGHKRDLKPSEPQPIRGVCFGPDSKLIAAAVTMRPGAIQPLIEVWDASTGEHLKTLKLTQSSLGPCVSFARTEPLLAYSCMGDVQAARARSFERGPSFPIRFDGEPAGLALSPDGGLIAYSVSAEIHVWETDTDPRRFRETFTADAENMYGLVFSADGKLLISGDTSGNLREWIIPPARESKE